jgi:hypothetical protein
MDFSPGLMSHERKLLRQQALSNPGQPDKKHNPWRGG